MKKAKWLLTGLLTAILFLPLSAYGAGTPSVLQEGDFQYTVDDYSGTATITGYTGKGGNVAVPATLGQKSVWNIDSDAFKNCTDLTDITVKEGITRISSDAFSGCTNLVNVTLPDTINEIGSCAFDGCTGLKTINLPGGLTEIKIHTFRDCDSLTDIVIPDNVASIGEAAFYSCDVLTSVAIPASVQSIDANAFHHCSSLNTIRISAANPVYDSRDNCNAIIRTADNTLLFGCAGTTIPDGITAIGSDAFFHCTGLTAITIPASVTSIGEGAFQNCSHLTGLTIAEGVADIGNIAFINCYALTDVVIPSSVKNVGRSAFSNCTDLASVTISEGVTDIGEKAFLSCENLKSITIPASVTSIGANAFGYTDVDGESDPNFIIRGASGSEAESYAKANGITAQPIPAGKTDLSAATISLEKDSYVCSQTPCTPAVIVKLGDKTLFPDLDYSVSYSDNIQPGTAKATITGKGQYTGSKTVNFTITEIPETPKPGQQQPDQQQPQQPGQQQPQQPAFSIICPKTVYNVTYGTKPFRIEATASGSLTWKSSNKKVAVVNKTGKVTIKGTGIAVITLRSGPGSVNITVRVKPKKPAVSSAKPAQNKTLAVKWKKDKRATGYQIQLSYSKSFKKIAKKMSVKKSTCTFTKLKSGKTCYVRIRSYKKSGSKKLYSAWSKPKKSGKIK